MHTYTHTHTHRYFRNKQKRKSALSAFSELSFTCLFLSLSFFFFSNFVFFPKFSCLLPCVLAISVAVFSVFFIIIILM